MAGGLFSSVTHLSEGNIAYSLLSQNRLNVKIPVSSEVGSIFQILIHNNIWSNGFCDRIFIHICGCICDLHINCVNEVSQDCDFCTFYTQQ